MKFRHGDAVETCSVADAGATSLLSADPILVPRWYPGRKSRAGLHAVASTHRLHSHDSLFERELLLLLDFEGAITEVASQPFTLRWKDGASRRSHTPDFMIATASATTVINLRPAELVTDKLLHHCGALAEVCLTHNWDFVLVTGYRQPALEVVTMVGGARREADPYGYGEEMLTALSTGGAQPFGRLVNAIEAPALARSVLRRLIWDGEASVNLNQLLDDDTLVALPGKEEAS